MPLLPFLLAGSVVFVDASATGANDGTSWRDAYTDLQPALTYPADVDVWVAEGTYRPSAIGDRSASFFVNNRRIYGGFDGTETTLDQRAGLFDRTILDGDLFQDDGPSFAHRADNSLHVVILGGPSLLDGFTVRGGYADGPIYHRVGGGISTWIDASPEIQDCRIVDNFAADAGGGVYLDAIYWADFRRCTFVGNEAGTEGGAAFTWAIFLEVGFDRCSFLENRSAEGGAVSGWSSRLTGCVFRGNRARGGIGGGAVRIRDLLEVRSCTFVENVATHTREGGGAIHFEGFFGTSLPVANSIFWRNADAEGTEFPSQIRLGPSCPGVFLQSSCVPAFHATERGAGNLRTDPELDGDLRPLPGSPCIDRGDDAFLGQLASTDLAGGLRAVDALDCGDGGVLDIGAYESQVVTGTTNYCAAAASSLGVPADLAGPCAWELHAGGDLPLSAGPVPPGGGLFFFGPARSQAPLGNGFLCVGGRLHRTPFVLPQGRFLSASVDLTDPRIAGKLLPGTCWSFQAWYRDAAAGGAGFNFSDAIRVTFR